MKSVMVQAGPLSAQYRDGSLRYIRFGGREVLRQVYVALRDRNWETIPVRISTETVENHCTGLNAKVYQDPHVRISKTKRSCPATSVCYLINTQSRRSAAAGESPWKHRPESAPNHCRSLRKVRGNRACLSYQTLPRQLSRRCAD